MDSIYSKFIEPDELLKEYSGKNDKFVSRFASLHTDMQQFVEQSGFADKTKINGLILGYALMDYFEDVRRLKDYHNVEHINDIKVIAYTAYWLLKRKPIQVIDTDKQAIDINERFVLTYILDYLSKADKEHILLRINVGLTAFKESLLYFLKYRMLTAVDLELAIISFFAGQIYQEEERDLSFELSKYAKTKG